MTKMIQLAGAIALAASSAWAGEQIEYTVESTKYDGYLAQADAPRGTIVILPTWSGLSDYEMDRARMLADMGFTTLAVDLYPTGQRPKTMEAKKTALKAYIGDQAHMRDILGAAISEARKTGDGPLMVMGYSMGALTAMELAWSGLGNDLNVDGYIIFSGRVADRQGRVMPNNVAPFFVALSEKDTKVNVAKLPDFVDDVVMAGGTVAAHTYPGGGHMFSAFGFPNYNAQADADSWADLTKFLAHQFGS